MQLFHKILSGVANNVDLYQTAHNLDLHCLHVWSRSALFAYVILSDTLVYKLLVHLPYLVLSVFSLNIGTS